MFSMGEMERFQITGSAADRYEHYLVPTLFEPWAKDIVGRATLQPDERVLDIACGTGVVARHVAQQIGESGSTTGIDLNEGMLEMARVQAERTGAKIEWRQGDAGALPFYDASFNVALCQQGLQFFPDKAAALREIHRVLMPGGRLVVSVVRSLEHNPLMARQIEPLTRYLGDEAASVQRAVCSLGDADELCRLHADAGFQDIDIQVVSLTIQHDDAATFIPGLMASLPFSEAIAALDDPTQNALFNDVIEGLSPYIDDQRLAIPHVAHVVSAHT
jgi:ubiquinone/menaquinone biosynthesis C-methylase UbiE